MIYGWRWGREDWQPKYIIALVDWGWCSLASRLWDTPEETNGKINYLENTGVKDSGFLAFFLKQKRSGTELGSRIRVQTRFWWEEDREKGDFICSKNQQVSWWGSFELRRKQQWDKIFGRLSSRVFYKFDRSPRALCLGITQKKKTWQGMLWQLFLPYPSFNKLMINIIFSYRP